MTDHRTNLIANIIPFIEWVHSGSPESCATFVLEDDESRWVQYMPDVINMACPYWAVPSDIIDKIGPVEINEFEPGNYLTVTPFSRKPENVAPWIYDWFALGLEADEGFVLDATREDLG